MASHDAKTIYRPEMAMAELDSATEELGRNAERIAALLALRPSPNVEPSFDSPALSSGRR
jgi:hypothetical protein